MSISPALDDSIVISITESGDNCKLGKLKLLEKCVLFNVVANNGACVEFCAKKSRLLDFSTCRLPMERCQPQAH